MLGEGVITVSYNCYTVVFIMLLLQPTPTTTPTPPSPTSPLAFSACFVKLLQQKNLPQLLCENSTSNSLNPKLECLLLVPLPGSLLLSSFFVCDYHCHIDRTSLQATITFRVSVTYYCHCYMGCLKPNKTLIKEETRKVRTYPWSPQKLPSSQEPPTLRYLPRHLIPDGTAEVTAKDPAPEVEPHPKAVTGGVLVLPLLLIRDN